MDLAKNKTEESYNNTGVIPPNYNLNKGIIKKSINEDFDSVFSDDITRMSNNSNDITDPLFTFNKINQFHSKTKESQKKILSNKQDNNSFLTQFSDLRYDNPSQPVSANNANGTQRNQIERELALTGGYSMFQNTDMTYGVVDPTQMTHNNMVPFIGKTKFGGYDPARDEKMNSYSQSKVDTFTGTINNPAWKHKQEQGKMFSPLMGLTNPFGQPVMTSFYQSRFIPGRERRNEKPFQETKVTPGLNLGYNEVGRQGFRDTYRVMPKTVDELRPGNKPKLQYKNVIIPGMKGQRGPIVGETKKRRPITFKEYAPEDLIPGVGDYRAQSIYGKYDPKNMATVNRGTSVSMQNSNVKFFKGLPTPQSMIPKVRTIVKEQFLHAEPRNVALATKAEKGRPNDEATTQVKITQRAVKNVNEYFGPLGNKELNKTYAFNTENAIPDNTMRNIHSAPDRAGFVGNTKEIGKTYAFDSKNAIPDDNMRTIHQMNNYLGHMYGTEKHNYMYDNKNAIPDTNMRNIHQDTIYAGNIGNGQLNQSYIYDVKNAIPDNNMRNIHQETIHAGNIGNGQLNQGYMFDNKNAIPDTNMRNIHQETKQAGNVGHQQLNQGYMYNIKNAIPDITMRNVHQDTIQAGNIGNGQLNQGYIYDIKNAIRDMNMRNIHQDTIQAGNVGHGQLNQGYMYNIKNAIPDMNMRNVHQDTIQAGNVGNGKLNQGYVQDIKNAIRDMNMRNIHQDATQAGNVGHQQFNQGYVQDIKNAIPDPTMREIHENTDRAGVIGNSKQIGKSYAFNTKDNIPDPTMREIYTDTQHVKPAKYQKVDALRTRDDAANAQLNNTKEVIAKGRAPTKSNYSRGPLLDASTYQLCDPLLVVDREQYPDAKQLTSNRLPFLQKMHVPLPQQSKYINQHIESSLQGNPFINNLVYVSHDDGTTINLKLDKIIPKIQNNDPNRSWN
jgi:hypothetical protein